MKRYPSWGMFGPPLIARWALGKYAESVRVEGAENVPRDGPVMLVARHYHHLLDGAMLVRYVPRPLHIVVGLDWAADARTRAWMERACNAACWPIVLRPATLGQRAAYAIDELPRYTRAAMRDVGELLGAGRVVLVFPEGYPNVDPAFAQKKTPDAFLPFNPGYARMIAFAQRTYGVRVAVVPVGFTYTKGDRWSIVARFGEPRFDPSVAEVQASVRALS